MLSVFPISLGVLDQAIESAAHFASGYKSNNDPTRLGLVQDIGRDDFQGDGETQPRGDFHRFGGRLGKALFGRRNPIGVAQPLGLWSR